MSAPPPTYGQATGYPTGYANPSPAPYPPQPGAQQAVTVVGGHHYISVPADDTGVSTQPLAPAYGAPPPAGWAHNQSQPMGEVAAPKDDNEGGWGGGDFAGSSFSDKNIRRVFIRKVYLILTSQLLVTAAVVCFFLFHKPTQRWVQTKGRWLYFVSYATFLVTYITLVCCPSVRRKWPGNFICLAVFTLAFSYMTGMITSFHDVNSVLIALGITAAVCISITLFAMQTKIDFTMCTGLIFALSMVLFFFGIAVIIVYMTIGFNYILHCVYGGVAALVFSLFLAYDTQMLLGGRKCELSPEEHIFGALQLYLDIVYIFLIVLSFFGGKGN